MPINDLDYAYSRITGMVIAFDECSVELNKQKNKFSLRNL